MWPFDDDWWNKEVGRGLQRRPRIDVFLNHWLTLRNRSETKPYNEFRVFGDYAAAQSSDARPGEETVRDIARDIGELGRIWDEHAIEARAKWLHEYAVKVWPHADGFDPGSG